MILEHETLVPIFEKFNYKFILWKLITLKGSEIIKSLGVNLLFYYLQKI